MELTNFASSASPVILIRNRFTPSWTLTIKETCLSPLCVHSLEKDSKFEGVLLLTLRVSAETGVCVSSSNAGDEASSIALCMLATLREDDPSNALRQRPPLYTWTHGTSDK